MLEPRNSKDTCSTAGVNRPQESLLAQSMRFRMDNCPASLVTYRVRIEARRGVLVPDVQWTGRREPVSYLRNDEALVSG